jgi:hypothetical protein
VHATALAADRAFEGSEISESFRGQKHFVPYVDLSSDTA